MNKKTIGLAALLLIIGVADVMAQDWGQGASYVESFIRVFWPIFLTVFIVGGGAVVALKYGFGKERDFSKIITSVLLSLVVICIIGAAYALAKTQSVF